MKFLVTGASGFVGKSLIDKLMDSHHIVVATSRKPLITNAAMFFAIPDYTACNVWDQPLAGCDVVIHLAARAHIMNDLACDPLAEFEKANVYASISLAKSAANAGVKRFIYISSIKVNGEYTASLPFKISDTLHPSDPYAISKWKAELALKDIAKNTGMELVIIRPPLIYGPEVKANFLKLMDVVYKKLPLPVGCVQNSRSMIFLGNFNDAIMKCAEHPNAANKTYLVSDGNDISTPTLIRKIAKILNRPSFLFSMPITLLRLLASLFGRTDAIDRLTESLCVDISAIRNDLNWTPPYSLDQGLEITGKWYCAEKIKRSA